jgi:hypothetical protein
MEAVPDWGKAERAQRSGPKLRITDRLLVYIKRLRVRNLPARRIAPRTDKFGLNIVRKLSYLQIKTD